MAIRMTNNFPALLANRREKISSVARKTGVSRTTLTNLYYDRGTAVSKDVIEKLCIYFGCEIGEILCLESSEAAEMKGV